MISFSSPSQPSDPAGTGSDADPNADSDESGASDEPATVLVFNANDPSGAGGLAADITAIASVGVHPLPVVTCVLARDTGETSACYALDEDAVDDQARATLEDIDVDLFKVGFAGSPEAVAAIAAILSDYADVPVVTYVPNLGWWDDARVEMYLDALQELILPQTTLLVGNLATLWRWLLPDWSSEQRPTPHDVASAAREAGVSYVLVTGIPTSSQHLENVLLSDGQVVARHGFVQFDAGFSGAGDTLTATLSALLANGVDLESATAEALGYLDQALHHGFQPGMGLVVPDRLFWARAAQDDDGEEDNSASTNPSTDAFVFPDHDTRH